MSFKNQLKLSIWIDDAYRGSIRIHKCGIDKWLDVIEPNMISHIFKSRWAWSIDECFEEGEFFASIKFGRFF
jgi:hypothetical protein